MWVNRNPCNKLIISVLEKERENNTWSNWSSQIVQNFPNFMKTVNSLIGDQWTQNILNKENHTKVLYECNENHQKLIVKSLTYVLRKRTRFIKRELKIITNIKTSASQNQWNETFKIMKNSCQTRIWVVEIPYKN